MERIGLTARRAQLAGALPGGYRKRLALACTLLHRPQMLFLDEPTAGVDPVSRREFWDLIVGFADEGDDRHGDAPTTWMKPSTAINSRSSMAAASSHAAPPPSSSASADVGYTVEIVSSDNVAALDAIDGLPSS